MSFSNMITSKDIIEVAGISRATLNNYIKSGLLPRPIVGPPRPSDRGVKQIGYFPEDVLARLDRIKLLKSQGKAMEDIVALLGSGVQVPATDLAQPVLAEQRRGTVPPAAGATAATRSGSRLSDRSLRVTIRDIETPAYLINRNFEVEWINPQAEDIVFGKQVRGLVDSDSRNIFRMFFERRARVATDDWASLATLHLTVLQDNINEGVLFRLYNTISRQESALLRDLFRARTVTGQQGIFHLPVTIALPGNIRKNYRVHAMTFREGTFFVYLPGDAVSPDLLDMLAQREPVVNDLLRHRMPSLESLCVLVADLQDSARISAELLPTQYFELINGLWECVGPLFEAHHGIRGKRVGEGMLYYFVDKPHGDYLDNCINCAFELREIMKKFSIKWRGIKGWDNDLYLNTGINEGQEFFGMIHSANTVEFTAQGDTINNAARLSEFAKNGEIWTTKNLISKLSREERNLLRFGVHGKMRPGNGFVRDSFARLSDLLTADNPHYRQLCAIAGLPVTEIKERVNSYPSALVRPEDSVQL